MLKSIHIRDFALIENTLVDWTAGLNVLTGETGAGKSILMDALSAVLGGKVSPSIIRPGKEKAFIEAVFAADSYVTAFLKREELLAEDNSDEVVVAREIGKSGSKVRINGTLVNTNILAELRAMLVTVHAQHEARTLMSPQSQLELLDGLGAESHQKLVDKVKTLYLRHRDLANELNNLSMSEEDRLKSLDFARFQWQELNNAELSNANEDEELEREISVLVNAIDLKSQSMTAQELLTGGNMEEISAVDLVQKALSEVEKSLRFDPSLAPLVETLQSGLASIEEASLSLRRYGDSLDTDPDTLSDLEARAALLSTIKRKYGPTLAEAMQKEAALAEQVDRLENSALTLSKMQNELAELEGTMMKAARELSEKRLKLSQNLSAKVEGHLKDLGMEKCRFEISFQELPGCGPSGIDRLEFLISPNPGQPAMPLAKIASGGELSRIMLAIKTIFASADHVSTVIFDEIDTGLSGRVLNAVRDKLAALSRSHQILCITHQPIVASVADNYLKVKKEHCKDETVVSVSKLDDEMRLRSLAAMASGNASEESLSFARSLMEQANSARGV